MTNIISFQDFQDNEIRVTPDGRYSVYDVIRFCGKKNPHDAWKVLCQQFPSLMSLTSSFQFPGKGQKETTVASGTICEAIVCILKKETLPPEHHGCLSLGANISESAIRDAVHSFCLACGENAQVESRCDVGIVDVLTNTTAIEVKRLSDWKAAVGQSVCYATATQRYPEVVLYGDCTNGDTYQKALDYCTQMHVACSVLDTSNGDAFLFTLGAGDYTYTNMASLTRIFRNNRN
jgi:hypothetical protein